MYEIAEIRCQVNSLAAAIFPGFVNFSPLETEVRSTYVESFLRYYAQTQSSCYEKRTKHGSFVKTTAIVISSAPSTEMCEQTSR
jgi:hypothetical protein